MVIYTCLGFMFAIAYIFALANTHRDPNIKDAVVLLICGGPILWFYAVSYWLYRLIKLLVESLK